VGAQFQKKLFRKITRWRKSKKLRLYALLGLASVGVISYAIYMNNKPRDVDPASYKPLLELIAQAESNDNYNAHFGNSANTDVEFTAMTIEEVQQWQREFVAQGSPSSAVGRYQIIDTTLSELIATQDIDPAQTFDEPTQDKFAIALLERRGSVEYVNQELPTEQFAANLAMEWAALPKVIGDNGDASYYAGDGLNYALVDKEDILEAVQQLRPLQ